MPLEIITKEDGKGGILDPKDGIEYEVFTSNKSVSGYAGVAKVPKKDGDKADKADKWRATYKDKTVGTFDTMIEAILRRGSSCFRWMSPPASVSPLRH